MTLDQISEGAVFKVIVVDPEGSGMDYCGHLGRTVENVKRCCDNCTVVVGDCGGTEMLFLQHELELVEKV